MTFYLFIAVVVLNIPTYVILFRAFFGNANGFWNAFGRANENQSLGKEENEDAFFADMQFLLFGVACISITIASYFVIAKFLLGFADPWEFLRN